MDRGLDTDQLGANLHPRLRGRSVLEISAPGMQWPGPGNGGRRAGWNTVKNGFVWRVYTTARQCAKWGTPNTRGSRRARNSGSGRRLTTALAHDSHSRCRETSVGNAPLCPGTRRLARTMNVISAPNPTSRRPSARCTFGASCPRQRSRWRLSRNDSWASCTDCSPGPQLLAAPPGHGPRRCYEIEEESQRDQ